MKFKSSFNGRIREIPGICVDNFENPATDGARAYFLSHYHADHIVGLDRSTLLNKLRNEGDVFIYATKMTCAIVIHNNKELRTFVKILNLGSNLITIPGDKTSNLELHVNVTLIPAGHCLGSTMFLFETTTSKVLFTGDFRIRTNDLPKYAAFHQDGDVIKLDALYVDTTFLDYEYEHFPKRSDSLEDAINIIKKCLDDNAHVVLNTSASYGYEHVFNYIYKVLKLRVYISPDKWEFYRTIHNLVPGVTNDPSETRIFLGSIPSTVVVEAEKMIRLSAMVWRNWNNSKPATSGGSNRYSVCFATHCSRSELTNFVEYLKPVTVVGFPNDYIGVDGCSIDKNSQHPKSRMGGERNFELTPRKSVKKRASEPSPCKDKKVDSKVLKKLFG